MAEVVEQSQWKDEEIDLCVPFSTQTHFSSTQTHFSLHRTCEDQPRHRRWDEDPVRASPLQQRYLDFFECLARKSKHSACRPGNMCLQDMKMESYLRLNAPRVGGRPHRVLAIALDAGNSSP